MLEQVASNANLAHSARFALVSFLIQINMSIDQIVELFNTSLDFDPEKNRYQVEHITGASGTNISHLLYNYGYQRRLPRGG